MISQVWEHSVVFADLLEATLLEADRLMAAVFSDDEGENWVLDEILRPLRENLTIEQRELLLLPAIQRAARAHGDLVTPNRLGEMFGFKPRIVARALKPVRNEAAANWLVAGEPATHAREWEARKRHVALIATWLQDRQLHDGPIEPSACAADLELPEALVTDYLWLLQARPDVGSGTWTRCGAIPCSRWTAR